MKASLQKYKQSTKGISGWQVEQQFSGQRQSGSCYEARSFFSSHRFSSNPAPSRSIPLSVVPTKILCGLKGSQYSVAEFTRRRFAHNSVRSRFFRPFPPSFPALGPFFSFFLLPSAFYAFRGKGRAIPRLSSASLEPYALFVSARVTAHLARNERTHD